MIPNEFLFALINSHDHSKFESALEINGQIIINSIDSEGKSWIRREENNTYLLVDRDNSGIWERPHPFQFNHATNSCYLFDIPVVLNEKLVIATSSSSGFLSSSDKSKLDGIEDGAEVNLVSSVAGRDGDVILTKDDVGLENVDNESKAEMFNNSSFTGETTAQNITTQGLKCYDDTNAEKVKIGRSDSQFITFWGNASANYITSQSREDNPKPLIIQQKEGDSIGKFAFTQQAFRVNDQLMWHEGNLPVESGTFTPRLIEIDTYEEVTYSSRVGFYQRSGNLCFFSLDLTTNSVFTNSGRLTIDSLPFTAADFNGTLWMPVTVAHYSNFNLPADKTIIGLIYRANSYIRLYLTGFSGTIQNLSSSTVGNNAFIRVGGTYAI